MINFYKTKPSTWWQVLINESNIHDSFKLTESFRNETGEQNCSALLETNIIGQVEHKQSKLALLCLKM